MVTFADGSSAVRGAYRIDRLPQVHRIRTCRAPRVTGFTPDGSHVFALGEDRKLRFFGAADGKPAQVVGGHPLFGSYPCKGRL